MRALIVDDEKAARERLIRLLSAYTDIEIVGEADNGKVALTEISRLAPEIVFLDIEMPELSGLETAAAIGLNGPVIVFVTAYDEYALKAFDTHAIDYLVKPIVKERLADTVRKLRLRQPKAWVHKLDELLRHGGTTRQRLAVKSGQRYHVLNLAEISAIVAKDHYAEISHGQDKLLADDSLEVLEARLDPARFLRIHRSSLINLDFLRELRRDGDRKYTALLKDYFLTELPVSREKLDKLRDHLLC